MARRNRKHEEVFPLEFAETQTEAREQAMQEARDYVAANSNGGWGFDCWFWEGDNLVVWLKWEGEQQSQEALRDSAPAGWTAVRSVGEAAVLNRIEGQLRELVAAVKGIGARADGFNTARGRVEPIVVPDVFPRQLAITAGPRDWEAL
jgi:hypothetical protein